MLVIANLQVHECIFINIRIDFGPSHFGIQQVPHSRQCSSAVDMLSRPLSNGRRALEQAARATVLDNFDYFGHIATFCDESRDAHLRRKHDLVDLQHQQEWKADQLRHRLSTDADIKKGR